MSDKSNIDVRDQVTLSFEKSFRFCRKGITYRLFRSSLTLAVVVVAVAFFTVLLSEGLIVRSAAIAVSDEIAKEREADSLMMHLFHRYTSVDLAAKLSRIREKPDMIAEFSHIAGIDEDAASALILRCYLEQRFLYFFNNMSAGKRAVLFKKNMGRDILRYIAEKKQWDDFVIDLEKMRSIRLPQDRSVLRSFLDDYERYLEDLQIVRKNRAKTVSEMEHKLAAFTGDSVTDRWIAEATDEEVEQWRKIVVDSGFDLSSEKMERVRRIMKISSLEKRIGMLLQTSAKRDQWKKIMETTAALEDKFFMLADESVGLILGDEFSMEERKAVSGRFERTKYLRTLSGKMPQDLTSEFSEHRFLDGRQTFLVVISFMVCMVGITNAMLMSITERFREIATMKCLGATDGFILKQFLIEAAIQGVVGGIAGMTIGMIISVLKSYIILGGFIFAHFPGIELLCCAVFTVVVGVLLAMFASIYPSRAAASMAPMDAMRVE